MVELDIQIESTIRNANVDFSEFCAEKDYEGRSWTNHGWNEQQLNRIMKKGEIHFLTIISIIVGGLIGWNIKLLLSWVEGNAHVKRSKRQEKDKES